MIVYKDILSSDILFTDDHRPEKVSTSAYQIKCEDKTVYSDSTDAEEEDRDIVWTGLNIIASCSLLATGRSKKDMMLYFQEYFKTLKTNLGLTQEQSEQFDADAEAFEKTILRRYRHYQLFLGGSGDFEGTYVFLEFKDDDEAFTTVFAHGVERTEE